MKRIQQKAICVRLIKNDNDTDNGHSHPHQTYKLRATKMQHEGEIVHRIAKKTTTVVRKLERPVSTPAYINYMRQYHLIAIITKDRRRVKCSCEMSKKRFLLKRKHE